MDETERKLAINSGKLGLIARGVVFLVSGWFLIQAALRFDPSQARGLAARWRRWRRSRTARCSSAWSPSA